MTSLVHLAPHEFDPHHPVSDPGLYAADRQLLAYMLQDLRALMRRHVMGQQSLSPYEVLSWSVHGLQRRTVICDPVRLDDHDDVHIVGFFGERRGLVETQPRIDRLEQALLTQFRDHPGVLSYSSVELVDDYWANLVMHTDTGDREAWRDSRAHREAAEDASPDHYRSVRIHHGTLRDGVCSSNMIELVRTKYWDYGEASTGAPVWTAVRELQAESVRRPWWRRARRGSPR